MSGPSLPCRPCTHPFPPGPEHGVGFAEATRVWAWIALLSFGGPANQIAVMHRILVEERCWIGEPCHPETTTPDGSPGRG